MQMKSTLGELSQITTPFVLCRADKLTTHSVTCHAVVVVTRTRIGSSWCNSISWKRFVLSCRWNNSANSTTENFFLRWTRDLNETCSSFRDDLVVENIRSARRHAASAEIVVADAPVTGWVRIVAAKLLWVSRMIDWSRDRHDTTTKHLA